MALLFLNAIMINLIEKSLAGYPEDICINYFAGKNPLAISYCFLMGMCIYLMIKEKKYKVAFAILIALVLTKFLRYPFELLFMIMVTIMVCSPQWTKKDTIRQIIIFLSKGSFLLYLIHLIILSFCQVCNRKKAKY